MVQLPLKTLLAVEPQLRGRRQIRLVLRFDDETIIIERSIIKLAESQRRQDRPLATSHPERNSGLLFLCGNYRGTAIGTWEKAVLRMLLGFDLPPALSISSSTDMDEQSAGICRLTYLPDEDGTSDKITVPDVALCRSRSNLNTSNSGCDSAVSDAEFD